MARLPGCAHGPAARIEGPAYCCSAHARPSGPPPTSKRPVIPRVVRSTTTMLLSAEQAINARLATGSIRMPAAPCPILSRFTSFCDAASYITRSPVPKLEMNTCFPSGVNFNRFAPWAWASILTDSFFARRSITDMVPSSLAAVHNCLPSGETSNPSDPLETGTSVCVHCSWSCPPGGGPCGFGEPCPPGGPCAAGRL